MGTMHHQLRVAAFMCGLALMAGCGGPAAGYVLPAINAPQDTHGAVAPGGADSQPLTIVPHDATAVAPAELTAQQP